MAKNQESLEIKEWLVETLPYEVMWMDENGKIVYANTKFCNRLGYNKSVITGLSIFDINPTSSRESWKKHWELVQKKGIHRFKETHKNKSGKYYEVEVFAQFFSNNRKKLICAIVNDISESSFYQKLMDNTQTIAHVGGWELNLQDGSIVATSEALQMFGTQNVDDLTPPKIIHQFKDPEHIKSLLNNAIRKGEAYDEVLETAHYPPRFMRCVAKPVLKGDKIYKLIGVYQDVTEQQLKENNLQLYKEVIGNAEDIVYVVKKNGDLFHHNKAAKAQLGFNEGQLNNASIFDLDPGITKEWWENHFNDVVEKGSIRFEWLAVRKNGTKFPVDITANHLRYNDEDYNCAIIRDISERKVRDLELFQALEEIKSLKDRLANENEYLQEEINSKINFNNIICTSEAYEKVLQLVDQVAPTDTTVLITGESGTGKELLASAIHNNSMRKDRPLIKINCATLPKELIESELFGHKKGAFTGAVADKVGKFSLADGGTIFLDEIGEMPIDLQPKLLRVLQEGEFDELGGNKTIKVNVRVVAATNRHLEDMIKEGTFREDLYYRLNVFPIHNIPLRARKEDIPMLAQYFLEKYSAKAGKAFKRLSKKTVEALMAYNFPGNIRELENLIERAVIIENGTTLNPGQWIPQPDNIIPTEDFKPFETMQRDYIIDVLNYTNWRVSGNKGAATILNMNAKTLFAKMKRLGIEKEVRLKR
ncbi:sigma 54-interacting transcriptional regulator [Muricauda ruestringensis]|uniref:sigma 54-interacting transcriptional regulator n=1 Tax=Flagellimonas ruestringensis TaxID=111501 RepID=UPI001CD464E9|nr:sigma 54-interacting transcriptional regulator [Allomuricauda ruestringensis]MCA0959743.1 sigma 54-interacting transcriptional regulator [Allomuricauda ruestringensis]